MVWKTWGAALPCGAFYSLHVAGCPAWCSRVARCVPPLEEGADPDVPSAFRPWPAILRVTSETRPDERRQVANSIWMRKCQIMLSRTLPLGVVAAVLLATPVSAAELSAAVGATGQGGATLRIGASKPWEARWFDSRTGHLSGYWDAGYTYWEGG